MNNDKAIRIMIADDHPIFRQGLLRAFSGDNDLNVVAEAVNGREILEKAKESKIDVVLLDVTMEGEWSLDYLKELLSHYPRIGVVVLSVYPEEHFAARYVKAGASGYLTKESSLETIKEAIRKVASCGRYFSIDFLEKMAFNSSGNNKPPHELLSDREFQVFRLLVAGHSLTAIAKSLYVSVKTVSAHRSHIIQKMNMESNSQLVQYAVLNKLI